MITTTGYHGQVRISEGPERLHSYVIPDISANYSEETTTSLPFLDCLYDYT